MFSQVRLKKGALNHFRKLARESPLEILAYLIGEVKSPEIIEIHSFAYTKTYYLQTECSVQWLLEEYTRVQKKAEEKGLRIVGFIHSHPKWDAVMSPDDYKSCLIEGHVVCGIVSVYGKKTRVRFWTPTSALPCKLTYT
jgi:proteasome lid subunit RPN8/RPN11